MGLTARFYDPNADENALSFPEFMLTLAERCIPIDDKIESLSLLQSISLFQPLFSHTFATFVEPYLLELNDLLV